MPESQDNYLNCKNYQGAPNDLGFHVFEHDAEFYFSFIEDGIVILCSEGYQSESGRDNGIVSVQKNMDLEERYAVIQTENGKWALSLKAGNHKEIARSCEVNSENEAKSFLPSERVKAKQAKLAALSSSSKSNDLNTAGEDDNYMICREYEEQFSAGKMVDGIISFQHENNKQYYFAWFDNHGQLILRSEGYPTASARDNGIESVKTNRVIEERFSNLEIKGAHFVVLKAGNHKEIGRSCPKKSADEVAGIMKLVGGAASVASINSLISEKEEVKDIHTEPVKTEEVREQAHQNEATGISLDESDVIKTAATITSGAAVTSKLKSSDIENTNTTVPPVSKIDESDEDGGGGFPWWWLLLLLGLLLLGWLLWKGCNGSSLSNGSSATVIATDTTSHTIDSTTLSAARFDTTGLDADAIKAKTAWSALGAMIEISLPDGNKITVPANGDEKKLVDFLVGGCQGDLNTSWFNMDRVLFKTGSNELNSVSTEQINNLIAIFKAFPTTNFKVGGYTDNVGSVSSNVKLSAGRADAAMKAILAGGIDTSRAKSKGYGPEHPVCPENDTDECKAKNRRVAIQIEKCK